jgi:dihydrofolate synthase/folylpolyglutamate synthase
MKFGLENMTALVSALGRPERTFRSVHIAGTNGKGSVTAMLEAALHRSGHRSARYTSPHLERLEERFVVSGAMVDTYTLSAAIEEVRAAVVRLQTGSPDFAPTFFECATAAAFVLFRSEHVQIAVVETGLGGRLDATNVVQPEATAITSIDFDHQQLLGNTLREIAREKAGIIKQNVPLVIGPLPPAAEEEILRVAQDRRAPVTRGRNLTGITPALAGRHQGDNIAVTAALADVLNTRGVRIAEPDLRHAVETVHWPARIERFAAGGTEFLLDAAHNPSGARALSRYLHESGWDGAALVFGAMVDKDAAGMLKELAPVISVFICTTAHSPRAARADELARVAVEVIGNSASVRIEEDPQRALALARSLSARVVIAGSMFLVGPLRGILR